MNVAGGGQCEGAEAGDRPEPLACEQPEDDEGEQARDDAGPIGSGGQVVSRRQRLMLKKGNERRSIEMTKRVRRMAERSGGRLRRVDALVEVVDSQAVGETAAEDDSAGQEGAGERNFDAAA